MPPAPHMPFDLRRAALGMKVQETFLVLDASERTQASGDPFTVLTLGNSTGTIATEPFWAERQPEVAGLAKGHAVQVIGEVAAYRGRQQLRVVSIRHLPRGSVDVKALLPSVGSVARYWETLDAWRREIVKPRLRRVVDLFYDDERFRERYEQCPGAVRGHHAQLGGLLKHTTEVAAIARTIARTSGADGELVLAGSLLHDIGKIEAYTWDGTFDTTVPGRLIGHVTLGALMLDRRLAEQPEPPCTELERQILHHLLLSHHGRPELGSAVRPLTLEAEILHWADNASAKTATLAQALSDASAFRVGDVSEPIRTLDGRRVFKGRSDWGAHDP